MDLEPNFPSIIPTTEEELSAVLVEFYQRGRSEVKPVPPPPPFEVTATVVQTKSSQPMPVERKTPPLVLQQQALATKETEFEFIPIALFGTVSFVFQLWFRCHNPGAVGSESYIRLHPGSFWRSVNPPNYSGGLAIAFSGTTWTPPAYNTQGTFVQMWITPLNIPPAPNYLLEAHAFFAMYIQEAQAPYHISDAIYPIGVVPNVTWYNASNGIGVDILFNTVPT
jgi:hypothetical protein